MVLPIVTIIASGSNNNNREPGEISFLISAATIFF